MKYLNYGLARVLLNISALLVIVLIGSSAWLHGQVIKGSISGNVIDQSGGAVPDVSIRATNKETGQEFTTKSESTGLFKLALLPIGVYDVDLTKSGFKKTVLSNVEVNAARDYGLGTVMMEVGQLTTTIEVSAPPPLLQTTQAQVTTSISSTMLTEFPGIQENQGLDQLALQIPGIVQTRDSNFSNTNGAAFAVNGIRGRNNDQQIDGQNNNDNSVTGPAIFLGDTNFVQEYQITTNNFGPEYGRNSGSVVNILTKSGTNNWHGSVYGTEGNSALDSLSNTQKAFDKLTTVPHYNDEFAGGTIGGPLAKDRAFIFAGFSQEMITGAKTVYSTGNLTPTPEGLGQLAACFPDSTAVAALRTYGPYGVSGGNPTPQEPIVNRTLTTPEGAPCSVQFGGVQRTLNTGSHQYNSVLRFDFQGRSDHVYGRWLYQKLNFFNADSFGTAAAGYPVNVPSLGTDWGLDWSHTFGPSAVNEIRFNYGRLTAEFGGNSIGNTVPPDTALGTGLANIAMPTGYLSFGPATSSPQGRIVNTYQLQDNLSYIRGRHQIKTGFNWTYQRSPNMFLPNYNGQFRFTTFNDFALNIPSTISITLGDPSLDFREHDFFAYVGDDWKIKPNLTLNLGLTWSYFTQASNLFNALDKKRETGPNPFFDPNLPLSVRVLPVLATPKNNWGPSAGFAYTPQWGGWLTGQGKTVLRGGYRLTYDPIFYNIYLNIASAAPQVLAQTLTGATAASNPLLAAPLGPAVRAQLAPFLTFGVADPRSFNQTNVAPDFRPDRIHQWSFGIQRQLTENAVFEARYVGNHGTDLFQSINSNPYIEGIATDFPGLLPSNLTPCSAANAVVPSAVGRANCNEGVIRTRTNTGVSDYNGLQLNFRTTNLAKQLTLQTSYTWSKTTDNATDIFNTGAAGNTLAYAQNPLDFVHGEHSLSGLDVPQNWTLSFAEAIPAFRDQKGVLGHLLGGWGVAGAYIISSGQPYTPVQYFFNTVTGGSNYFDTTFDRAFIGFYETARPYLSNPNAPVTAVGVYAADACAYAGAGCDLPATTMLNFQDVNQSRTATTVQPGSVRFIMNGPQANQVFGKPWGTAPRNSLRDYHVNIANFTLYKDIKFGERVKLQWHMTMLNVFNHPNFGSIDPVLEDLGDNRNADGFGLPTLQESVAQGFTGGTRSIRFGLKVLF
jgi:hypothetical protein